MTSPQNQAGAGESGARLNFIPKDLVNLDPATPGEKIDVAVNIFAKPWQTSLSVLSLLRHSAAHVGTIWLQYEPVGSRHDKVSPYRVAEYLTNVLHWPIKTSQPDYWLERNVVDPAKVSDPKYRMGIRYQNAFENSKTRRLFLMHNDVFFFKDLLGDMAREMGDAFAIGQLGQCWNCPASRTQLTRRVMNSPACAPARYDEFRPTFEQLQSLYQRARREGIFVRPYEDGLEEDFKEQPWPLPECRINEWACLIDLEKTRPHTIPFGTALPPGGFRFCGDHRLDLVVAWFRQMHALGMHARHFNIYTHMRHWVGTGKKTPLKYVHAEDNARRILEKHYPEYVNWLEWHYPT